MNQETHWEYTKREWESDQFFNLLQEAFTQEVRVVYDVGACVGGWSAVVTSHWPVEIHAFEPYPDNFKALVEHALPIIAMNMGVWYGRDEAKASWRGGNVGAIFIDEVDRTDSVDTGQVFKLTTLEKYVESHSKPDLIKFDVEGAEKNIIEHSELLKTIPQVIVEWHFVGVEDAKAFFTKHLPHKVIYNIQNGMYLLRL